MERLPKLFLTLTALFSGLFSVLLPASAEPRHGIAMHGEPLYPAQFTHFGYVNPETPKGGELRYAVIGSFDSLNPFIVQGTAALGLRESVFESLMARSYDEPFSLYGLLAKSIETTCAPTAVAMPRNTEVMPMASPVRWVGTASTKTR